MKEKAFQGSPTESCWNIADHGRKERDHRIEKAGWGDRGKNMGNWMDYVQAFWVGGVVCALVQILLDRTKMMPGRVMVLLVVTGTILGFLNWFGPLQEYAGAGVSVPLLGFGNILWKGVKEAVDQYGFLGTFMGGFKASAVGISAALIFGYLASILFEPKMKK